ncbi:DUF485 domain-containing protein [Streptomyces sp. NBS 14/10]|uniref:DUF485 domain-containing protein n=1 Tax=Streptomyces sp. NBS 14/10 TaxID=1945643 RepID=UPI000B7C8784|nr:DUF485 domain-containing protein [Streptomyces sp. NBS 14/10]KAK1184246.1 DUF485 domain-containing protein [Streptomyces sp. NBS 14/10]NUS85521.1 DUF485 domain-containing protein [Streptomyces sp.]
MSSPPKPIDSAESQLTELERRHRRFVWPAVVVFVGGYLTTMAVVAYRPHAMAAAVFGRLNVGYLLVLGNFALTFLVAIAYRWYAERRLDPQAQRVRAAMAGRSPEGVL